MIKPYRHFLFAVILLLQFSCDSSELEITPEPVGPEVPALPLVPEEEKMYTRPQDATAWLACDEVRKMGGKCKLPWYEATPDFRMVDVDPGDGWRLWASTLQIVGYEHDVIEQYPNFIDHILFYNIHTGKLKIFTHGASNDTYNYVVIQLRVDKPTRLFNFTTPDALALDTYGPQEITLFPTFSSIHDKPEYEEWRCSEVELAYDPNSNEQTLSIHTYEEPVKYYQQTHLGEFTQKQPLYETAVSSLKENMWITNQGGYGDKGLTWLSNQIGKENNTPVYLDNLIRYEIGYKGIEAAIENDLYQYLNSFSGTLGKRDITYATHAPYFIEGRSMGSEHSSPTVGIRLGNDTLNLGVWNLKETPRVMTASDAICKKRIAEVGYWDYRYEINHDSVAYELVINPKYRGSFQPEKHTVVNVKRAAIESPSSKHEEGVFLEDLQEGYLYNDKHTIVKPFNYSRMGSMANVRPNRKTLDGTPAYSILDMKGIEQRGNLSFLLKLRHSFETEPETFYSAKSFQIHTIYKESNARHYNWTDQELIDQNIY